MRYYRKVIRITAEDSPNVRLAFLQKNRGIPPTGEVLVPGVLTWDDYVKRRATWDKVRQCIGLDAQFYVGPELLLFPPEWLNGADAKARLLFGRQRVARAIGIDPAEGGDKTAMAVVYEDGLIELVSKKTKDTSVITSEALAFMRFLQVTPDNVVFDRGGGGHEHADRLRSQGYKVRTVAFGESTIPDPRRGIVLFPERLDIKEERYAYVNRRAEMYGELSRILDPSINPEGFAIPSGDAPYAELRR